MGHETTGAKFGRSRSRGFGATGMRSFGFPFEWDMAYNNLPCTNVQAVINLKQRLRPSKTQLL